YATWAEKEKGRRLANPGRSDLDCHTNIGTTQPGTLLGITAEDIVTKHHRLVHRLLCPCEQYHRRRNFHDYRHSGEGYRRSTHHFAALVHRRPVRARRRDGLWRTRLNPATSG